MTHPYASQAYAEAFAPEYTPVHVPQGGYVLRRAIANTGYYDAVGTYPLMPLQKNAAIDWEPLRRQEIVSLVLVADPFFSPPEEALRAAFDHVVAYKTHYLHDPTLPCHYSSQHRYKINQARKRCELRIVALEDYIDAWCDLYRQLVEKHGITGIQRFSRDYFTALAAMRPLMMAAFVGDELVSAHLWLEHEGHVYAHLAASSETGYRIRAAYAVYDASIAYFAKRGARMINLGGGAGIMEASGGLAQLKEKFSNGTTTCYLCGKILNADIYRTLSGNRHTAYFPAYRA